jgi:UDP-N-acetylglucosamine diphosphorylase / glucose-1-phosphate thymidylyltransferase / UDP-N-acetylgalactosamine diphosphorylase / glucosamine-1-phosphate N-acetyltransferase / galactosamine-1-phosphate N-acetyltransferase
MKFKVIITAAGDDDSNFLNSIYSCPKNLAPFRNSNIINSVLASYSKYDCEVILIILEEEDSKWSTSKVVLNQHPNVKIIKLRNKTNGAMLTSLFASDLIDEDDIVIVASGDAFIEEDLEAPLNLFQDEKVSSVIVTFNDINPRWSYLITNESQEVIDIAEKETVSEIATTGIFMFRNINLLIDSVFTSLEARFNKNDEFYMSSAIASLLSQGLTVQEHRLASKKQYIYLSRPSDLIEHTS